MHALEAGFDKVMSKELEAMHYKKFLFKYFFVQQIIDDIKSVYDQLLYFWSSRTRTWN